MIKYTGLRILLLGTCLLITPMQRRYLIEKNPDMVQIYRDVLLKEIEIISGNIAAFKRDLLQNPSDDVARDLIRMLQPKLDKKRADLAELNLVGKVYFDQ